MADTCIFCVLKIYFDGRIADNITVKLDSGVILKIFLIIPTFIPSNLLREMPVTPQEKEGLTAAFLEVL